MFIQDLNTKKIKRYNPKPGDMLLLHKGQGTISYGLNPVSNKNPKIGSYKIIWNERWPDDKVQINKLLNASKTSTKDELELFKTLAEFFASGHGMHGVRIDEKSRITYAVLEKL